MHPIVMAEVARLRVAEVADTAERRRRVRCQRLGEKPSDTDAKSPNIGDRTPVLSFPGLGRSIFRT